MADSMDGISVYNLPVSKPNWDHVGIFYITWCGAWTACLVSGIVFLWYHRQLPILKIRGLPLTFSAILLLHCYWILAQITYPIGATLPVLTAYSVQYFFMGIWLPLGIALFHASNLRFLYVAKMQKQFTEGNHLEPRESSGCNGRSSFLCQIRNMAYMTRVLILIGSGMVIQVLLTIAMWIACLKYHPSFGIPGTGLTAKTIPGQLQQLARGWEWWPSVLWQVVWTWLVAPYLIWKCWGIRDTMGWRFQTLGCCLSNLHATPMFLVAQYVPAFEKVNRYFSPSQWIHLSILMFEIFTVFVPVFQVIRLFSMQRKSAAINAEWETSSQTSTLVSSSATIDGKKKHFSFTLNDKDGMLDLAEEDLSDRLFTMGALDHVLSENPSPLQEFSALRDFSGENIAFLIRIAQWKKSFVGKSMSEEEERRDAFARALWIYIDFVSPRDARFPLNLSSADLKLLEGVFEQSARTVCGEEALVNPATPFDVEQPRPEHEAPLPHPLPLHEDLDRHASYSGAVPCQFNAAVFDKAQSDVKYLVLTNTWPKFVAEMQSRRRRSSEASRSAITFISERTLASRVSARLRSML